MLEPYFSSVDFVSFIKSSLTVFRMIAYAHKVLLVADEFESPDVCPDSNKKSEFRHSDSEHNLE